MIIVGGGGDAPDSEILDKIFMEAIGPKKVLYIPLAWKAGDFEACRTWFSSTFAPLGLKSFEMCTDCSGKDYDELESFGALYIGGGNTFVLLDHFRKTGFIDILKRFIGSGRPVYGGSAGAIILGKSIETASFGGDADENSVQMTNFSGLNLIKGYSLQCHYEESQDEEIEEFVKKTGFNVIALSEKTGLCMQENKVVVKGYNDAYIFSKEGKQTIKIDQVIR